MINDLCFKLGLMIRRPNIMPSQMHTNVGGDTKTFHTARFSYNNAFESKD